MDTIDLLKNHFCDFFGDNTFDPTKTIKTFEDVCNIAKVNIEHYILPKTATKNDIRDNAYDMLKLIISVFNQIITIIVLSITLISTLIAK